MGTIKDLVDLTTKLAKSVKDRKIAEDLRDIQKLILSIQSEQATIHEKNMELMTENSELKKRIINLESRESGQSKLEIIEDRLPEKSEELLLFIANSKESVSKNDALESIGDGIAKSKYYFDQLKKCSYIHLEHSDCVDLYYIASKTGREYLVKYKLI